MNTLQHLSQEKRKKRQAGAYALGQPVALIAVLFLSVMLTAKAQSPIALVLNSNAAQQAGNSQENTPSQLTIRFSNEGLSPASATVLAGKILLKVENQRPLERLTLRINRQGGELIREVALPDKATEWTTELELGVGQYVVSETSRTGGSCVLTVQAPPAGQ
jgi:hypothetical protein